MKHLFLCVLLVMLAGFGYAQTGRLIGSVVDTESRSPLELATVSIFNQDSSLVTYQLSDRDGRFTIEKLPLKRKLLVSVTYTGYTPYQTYTQLTSARADTLVVFLKPARKDTNAVVVTATVPVRMNGDTLEINPAAFKMKSGSVVEELLNQVPGITIWSDGSITSNGKQVQSLLVDGKPFMGSTDPRVATQNLPKAAIDKIQLYQEYDRSQIGQLSQPQDSLLTMNIKLKEGSKKGYFGKAGMGIGTDDRFESDLSLQTYNKQSSIGVGGGINNINKNIGNIQEMFVNNSFRNFNPNLYNVGRFGSNGINRNFSFGSLITHNFIESTNSRQNNRLTVNFNTSGTNGFVTDLSLQNRATINNPQQIREEGVQNNKGYRNDLGINYIRTNSYNDNLSFNGALGNTRDNGQSSRFSEVRDSAGKLQSTNRISSMQNRHSENASLSLSYAKSDRDEPLKNFNLQVNARSGRSAGDRDANTEFESFIDPTKNTSFNRHYTTNNQSVSMGAILDYGGFKRLLLGRYNLFGINLNFTQAVNYDRNTDQSVVSDYDSTTKKYNANNDISNRNERSLFEYQPALALSKVFSRWGGAWFRNFFMQLRLSEDFKTDQNRSSLANRNLDRSFQFLRIDGNFNFSYNKREEYQLNMSLGYGRSNDYPSLDQLYPIIDNINAYDIRMGNPFLRNKTNHRFNLNMNFNSQKPKSLYAINGSLNGGFTKTLDPTTDSVINDPSGKRFTYYVNADQNKNYNLNYNINIVRKFNKNQLQLMYNGQFNSGSTPNYVDSKYNVSATSGFNNQATLQYSLNTVLILSMTQSFQYYKTGQSAAGLAAFKNRSNTTRFSVTLNAPENFSFSSTFDQIRNTNLDKPSLLWNAFATYRFMKQQGELKFSAMDVLKQYQNISNSVNAYGTTTRFTNGLQQYFLLTFSYYPRKFGKTAMKGQAE